MKQYFLKEDVFSSSPTIRKFIEDSKDWSKQELLDNALIIKRELKKLHIDKGEVLSALFPEVDLYIDFLRKLLFYFQYYKHPAGMSEKDFELIKQIADRYR